MSTLPLSALGGALSKYALLGMRQAGTLPPLALGHPALDALLVATAGGSAGADLCRRASLLALLEAAAAPLPRLATSAPPPLPEDPRPLLSAAGVAVLEHALHQGDVEALIALLDDVETGGRTLPAEFLVRLPGFSPQHRWRDRLRTLASPALLWLARQHAEWHWLLKSEMAQSDPLPDFDLASGAARVRALAALRADDPASARDRLVAAWPACAPEERAALLPALATGLGPADEAWLERLLEDRRKEVRASARALLLALPDSGLRQRALARLGLLFTVQADGQLEIALPAAHDQSMGRDGIEPKPPPGVGERNWWLAQLLGQVRLDQLAQLLGLPAARLLAALQAHADRQVLLPALVRGWVAGQDPAVDATWVGVLTSGGSSAPLLLQADGVVAQLAHPALRPQLLDFLSTGEVHLLALALPALPTVLPQRWERPLSAAMLQASQRIQDSRHQRAIAVLESVLPAAILRIPATADLLDGWAALPAQGLFRRDQTVVENRLYWRRALAAQLPTHPYR